MATGGQLSANQYGNPVTPQIKNTELHHTGRGEWVGHPGHAEPDAHAGQEYLPDSLADQRFYEPSGRGFEAEVAKRLEYWKAKRRAAERDRE